LVFDTALFTDLTEAREVGWKQFYNLQKTMPALKFLYYFAYLQAAATIAISTNSVEHLCKL
jgi:hypothetical protein